MPKKIFVLLQNIPQKDLKKKPFRGKSAYARAYQTMAQEMHKMGYSFVQGSIKNIGSRGIFKSGWVYTPSGWKFEKNIKPDVVYIKVSGERVPLIRKKLLPYTNLMNHIDLDHITSDKWLSYKALPKFTLGGFLVKNKKDFEKAAKKIKTDRVVLKPVFGSAAEGIQVVAKNKPPKKYPHTYIAQDVFDASGGIPGVTKGVSDLRVILIDGKIAVVYARKSGDGFFTNQAMGAQYIPLTEKKLTPATRKIVREVDKKFAKYGPRLYTIDFVYDKNGQPWVMEYNAKPALYYVYEADPKLFVKTVRAFVKSFDKLVAKSKKRSK